MRMLSSGNGFAAKVVENVMYIKNVLLWVCCRSANTANVANEQSFTLNKNERKCLYTVQYTHDKTTAQLET